VEITRQADYYGLPERPAQELPSQEKIADLLQPAALWESPLKADKPHHHHHDDVTGDNPVGGHHFQGDM